MDKLKVNFYIDGFNFYFGLKSKKWRKYFWLDMVGFCEKFLKDYQELNAVYYFTAAQFNQAKKDRQDLFLSANRLNPKFKVIYGKYLKKVQNFGNCKHLTFEEKQTDVNIAVEMIRNVIYERNQISILVSADSDLLPPIHLIKELSPDHKIFCFFPPARHSTDLEQNADVCLKLARYEHRFKTSQLPESITLSNGYIINKPPTWV